MRCIYFLVIVLLAGCVSRGGSMEKTIEITGEKQFTLHYGEKITVQKEQPISIRYLGVVDGKQTLEINKIPVSFERGVPRTINRVLALTIETAGKVTGTEKGKMLEFSIETKDGKADDTIRDSETKRIFVHEREYLISALLQNNVAFIVNGEETPVLETGKSFVLRSGNAIIAKKVREMEYLAEIPVILIRVVPA